MRGPKLRIWVDADSCPRPVREIIQRAAGRTGVDAIFVANRDIPGVVPADLVVVGREEGAADAHILEHSGLRDLVVTRDIPLAKELVDRGRTVLNDRGEIFSPENVGERLSIRNFMYHLRKSGLLHSTERTYGQREQQAFANSFDKELTRLLRADY
ncbi:MAG TPA: DUF188 domain-containing protein [Spirochaetia bacterium]|nr:DUF188 domain-containing protein [Spirochaetia bacterium]